jgi:hypothetical protein
MHCADVKVRVMQQLQICSRVAQCGKANLPPRARPCFLARNGGPIHGANPAAAKKGCKTFHSWFRRVPIKWDVLGKFYGQATKSVRWMPWRQQAMKDVASCDKPRGAASRL